MVTTSEVVELRHNGSALRLTVLRLRLSIAKVVALTVRQRRRARRTFDDLVFLNLGKRDKLTFVNFNELIEHPGIDCFETLDLRTVCILLA